MTSRLAVSAVFIVIACGGAGEPPKTIPVAEEVATEPDAGVEHRPPADFAPPSEAPKANYSDVPPIEIPNGRLYHGYVVGGLPSKAQVDAALEEGIDSTLSVMASEEAGVAEVAAHATRQGMRYLRLTISGPEELNEAMAWQFASTIALLDTPAIIHSADGRRVAAVFALVAYYIDERPADEAIAIGVELGMGELRSHVEAQLRSAE